MLVHKKVLPSECCIGGLYLHRLGNLHCGAFWGLFAMGCTPAGAFAFYPHGCICCRPFVALFRVLLCFARGVCVQGAACTVVHFVQFRRFCIVRDGFHVVIMAPVDGLQWLRACMCPVGRAVFLVARSCMSRSVLVS